MKKKITIMVADCTETHYLLQIAQAINEKQESTERFRQLVEDCAKNKRDTVIYQGGTDPKLDERIVKLCEELIIFTKK